MVIFVVKKWFAKLRASRAFASYVPSSFRAFASYVPSYLRTLRALFTRLIYAPSALTVRLQIFLGWIFSTAETFHFLKTIKVTTNHAVFMRVKKQPWYFLSGEIC